MIGKMMTKKRVKANTVTFFCHRDLYMEGGGFQRGRIQTDNLSVHFMTFVSKDLGVNLMISAPSKQYFKPASILPTWTLDPAST